MTSDARALLRAIRTFPAEDAPRAAYADYLQDLPDEHARWYGQFIAEQLAGKDDGTVVPCAIVGPAGKLLDNYGVKIHHQPRARAAQRTDVYGGAPPVEAFVYHVGTKSRCGPVFEVERGFITRVTCDVYDFMRIAGALFAHHPVSEVTLTDRSPVYTTPPPQCSWWRFSKSEVANSDRPKLPNVLFDLMPNGYRIDGARAYNERGIKTFADREPAFAALHVACMIYGANEAERFLANPT